MIKKQPWYPNKLHDKLIPYGIAGRQFTDAEDAKGNTYTEQSGNWPPTRLIHEDNPYSDVVKDAKYILEIGVGCGRNVPYILEETEADFYGIDPNESQLCHFWHYFPVWLNDQKHRVHLYRDFTELPEGVTYDVIFSVATLMHLGYRYNVRPNITDIVQSALKVLRPGGILWMLEHEREEAWQERMLTECAIEPDVYEKYYTGLPEMTHRGTDMNLIIWKKPCKT